MPSRFVVAVLLSLLLPRPRAAAAQGPAAAGPPPATASGVSRELARHRAATISDVRYDLRLDVTSLDSAPGRVKVRFRRAGRGDVVLDYRGRLGAVRVNGAATAAELRQGHLVIPAAALRTGPNEIELAFVSAIAPSGASVIRAHDPTDGSDYLYTLLVPSDASQLFPCFDQPDLKARVSLALTMPRGWSAVSNGSLAAADSAGPALTARFAETRPISTYLIAFAAGPWHRQSATVEGRTLTAWVRRSRAAEADLDTLLALNARALRWMERYFGHPYPFEKFDFVLAPAFPFGGMEHPGAVFYSEDGFIFRERPTLPRRLGRMSTILHEAAHQWFGDLVTMRWFDDLWLKEGFATFMAAKALADLEPGADAWKTFHLANKPAAYAVDRTRGTRPLWQELGNLDQAKSNYGAIVYNKAPSVLKQLEYLVGEPAFQAGVQGFLRRHAYGNADWRDLLGAIAVPARRPLGAFGREFMLRAGMPVVEQRLEVRDGRITRLALAQRPASDSGATTWTQRTEVVLAYRDGPARRLPVELRGGTTLVREAEGAPAPDFVFANARDFGYFLLLLDTASVRALEGGALGRVDDAFLRAMLWGSLWEQVRSERLAPERFVRLAVRELPQERDEQIVPVVLARLDRAMSAYLAPRARGVLQEDVERMLERGATDTALAYGVRKAYADAFIALAVSPRGVAAVDALLDADSLAGEPLRDPTRWDAVTRLLVLGAPSAEARLLAQARRDTTPDSRRQAFIAGAGRPQPTSKREYWTRYFADSTLNEEWAFGSLGPFNSLEHETATLPYLGPALDSLPFLQANRRIFFLESWLAAFLRGQTSDSALAVVRGYLAGREDLPLDLRRKVLQHLDELERTVRIRSRDSMEAPPGTR